MDYTLSNSYATDAGTTQRMHAQSQAIPTAVSDADINMLIWELMEIVKAAGLAGAPFDKAVPGSYQALIKAIKRLTGGNVTTVNFAASPFSLTADHAGMVLVDATGGNVVINLPAASALVGLPYAFRRVDATANTVTVNRAGADTINEGGTSFALLAKAVQIVRSNGVATWSSVIPLPATQAETDAGADEAKFVTPKKLRFGFLVSLALNGYIVFPTWLAGLILQWGGVTQAGASQAVTFPIAFTSVFSLNTTRSDAASAGTNTVCNAAGVTATGFTLWHNTFPASAFWFACGR